MCCRQHILCLHSGFQYDILLLELSPRSAFDRRAPYLTRARPCPLHSRLERGDIFIKSKRCVLYLHRWSSNYQIKRNVLYYQNVSAYIISWTVPTICSSSPSTLASDPSAIFVLRPVPWDFKCNCMQMVADMTLRTAPESNDSSALVPKTKTFTSFCHFAWSSTPLFQAFCSTAFFFFLPVLPPKFLYAIKAASLISPLKSCQTFILAFTCDKLESKLKCSTRFINDFVAANWFLLPLLMGFFRQYTFTARCFPVLPLNKLSIVIVWSLLWAAFSTCRYFRKGSPSLPRQTEFRVSVTLSLSAFSRVIFNISKCGFSLTQWTKLFCEKNRYH